MITVAGITVSVSTLFIAFVWMVGGALCTLLTSRRGMYIAIFAPLIVAVIPQLVIVGPDPQVVWLPYRTDISRYVNFAAVPFFASIVGGLIGELIMPSEEEE